MTSYSVERPVRPSRSPRVRPGLVHLHPGQATPGQPVTIRTLDPEGNEIEFPAVYVRRDPNRLHMVCTAVDEDQPRRYRPSQVFPRRESYRGWTVTLRLKVTGEDGDKDSLLPVRVNARTELEARYEALRQIRSKYGYRANWRFSLHSVARSR